MSSEQEQAERRRYALLMATLAWLIPAVIGFGLLYLLSVWVMHDPLKP
jgi:hypothetical protein